MIPKVIHYCWFGGKPLPDSVKVYMDSWKKYLPDFQIKRWDESNFDVNKYKYVRQAYYARRYAFVSDVARLYALSTEGGLYLDTDILIKRSLPKEWFELKGFCGFEHERFIGTGIIACEANHPFYTEFLANYERESFFCGLKYNISTNVGRHTKLMENKGFVPNNKYQLVDDFAVFPQQLLCGKDWLKGRYDTDETYVLHDFQGTWGKDFLYNRMKYRMEMVLTIFKWHFWGGKNMKF